MAADDEPDIPTATGAAIPSVAFVNVVHVSAHHPGELERVLHQAFDAQVNGVSTRVVLAPGVYCVSLTFNWARENAAVVAIEAEVSGTAIFSGADRFSGWRRMGELWCADWPYDCAAAPAPPDFNNPFLTTPELMLRREVLVMDGKVLRQQLAASELAPGSFYVDAAARTITLSPPGGKDPAHAVCEVATRSIALHLAGRKNVILRGLVFRHDASLHAAPLCAPLQISSCNNVVVEDCQFSANNNKGIYLGGSQNHNITIRNSRFNGNGCIGLNAANCTNLLIEGCETNLNNWRGNWAGVYRRWPCGLKVSRSNRVTIRIHRSIRNMATGGWIDLENRDVRVEDSIFYGNYRGLHLEAGEGPYLVQRCQIAANRQEPLINEWRWSFGSGLVLTHARGVMLKNNLIFDNDVAQVGVRDDRDKHVFRDPVSGVIHEWYTERVSLKNNTIIATDANPTLLRLPSKDFDGGRFWQQFRASDNNYFGMRHAKAFVIGAGAGLGEACSAGQSGLGSCNGSYTFDEWRNASGQDAGAHFNDGDVADLSPPDGLVT